VVCGSLMSALIIGKHWSWVLLAILRAFPYGFSRTCLTSSVCFLSKIKFYLEYNTKVVIPFLVFFLGPSKYSVLSIDLMLV